MSNPIKIIQSILRIVCDYDYFIDSWSFQIKNWIESLRKTRLEYKCDSMRV